MTTFEYFKIQLDDAVAQGCGTTAVCKSMHEPMSYAWIKCAADWFFGGAWDYEMKEVTDLKEMKEQKFIKILESQSYRALRTGQTRKIALTNKGLKEFYKRMIEQR